MSKPVILLAIDSCEERTALATQLGAADIACQCVDQPTDLVDELDKSQPATVIVDISFGGRNAHHLLRSSALRLNGTPVVFRARRSATELELALEASLSGAGHFLLAPHDQQQLGAIIDRARCYFQQQQVHASLPSLAHVANGAQELAEMVELEELLIGSSRAIEETRATIRRVATTSASLLIQGEAGTGKQLVAKAIHDNSPWRQGPWVVVDTATITPGDAERHLFGSRISERGGDWVVHQGRYDAATGGTLFLSELGELEWGAQLSLLQRLERQANAPTCDIASNNIRVIAATSRNPQELVTSGRLRPDLCQHLQVASITLPPLRHRMADLAPLARHFLRQVSQADGRGVEDFSNGALDALSQFSWPGNLDQLRNVVERMARSSQGPLVETATIPVELKAVRPDRHRGESAVRPGKLQAFSEIDPERDLTPLQRQERLLIIDALAQTEDRVVDAAHLLKMGQATIYRKIRQYHIAHARRRRKRV